MAYVDSPNVAKAKQHISSVIDILRANDAGYADMLQELLDGMEGWYSTKENLYKVGQVCHPKALGDGFMNGYSAFEWLDEVISLRDDCARAFNELEQSGA